MPRPTEKGIKYFSLDVDFDDEIQLYLAATESDGLATLIALWQVIYRNDGYYVKDDKYLIPKIKKRCYVPTDIIKDNIDSMIDFNILNGALHDKYKILTSRGIQKRYFMASKRKLEIEIIREFMLLEVNVSKKTVIVYKNPENVDVGTQTERERERESKQKQRSTTDEQSQKNQKKTKELLADLQSNFKNEKRKTVKAKTAKQHLLFLLEKKRIPKAKALQIVSEKNEEFLLRKLIEFDYKVSQNGAIENPVGYLIKFIENGWNAGAGFDEYFRGYKINNDLPEELKRIL